MQNKENAPAPISALSYAVSIVLSGASGDELALFKNVSQSVSQSVVSQSAEFFRTTAVFFDLC